MSDVQEQRECRQDDHSVCCQASFPGADFHEHCAKASIERRVLGMICRVLIEQCIRDTGGSDVVEDVDSLIWY